MTSVPCGTKSFWNIYIDLHRDTPAAPRVFSASTADSHNILRRASSYPLCDLPGHHHPHVQDVVDDTTGVTAYTPANISSHPIDDSSSIFIPPPPSPTTPFIPPTPFPSDFSTLSLSGDIPDSPNLDSPRPIITIYPLSSSTSPIRTPILEDSVLPPVVIPVEIPSPSLDACAVQTIEFHGYGEFAALLCHSPHSILYQDELYPTALHLFEARKFIDQRPDLAERIRECERIEDVTSIGAEMANFARQDWENVALITMDEVLYLKFRQHGALRTLLFNTYPMELVYSEFNDPFWGDCGGGGGNELGKSLMRVRDRLRAEGGM
ncbi:hypothetical protein BJV78DRAFT_559242 [Lactifluus subvellereus]|nr:hypothetical protein BJV78DRAFT_559242 [Lactifluus subvellereus]